MARSPAPPKKLSTPYDAARSSARNPAREEKDRNRRQRKQELLAVFSVGSDETDAEKLKGRDWQRLAHNQLASRAIKPSEPERGWRR